VRRAGGLGASLIAGLLSLLATGAAAKRIDVAQWTEEVLLHDQRLVTVTRQVRAYSGGFPNASRGRDIDEELRYAPSSLRWQTTVSASRLWPISFEIFDGVPYLVLYFDSKAACAGKPASAYSIQVLRWTNDRWIEVPAADFPVDQALMNLSMDYWGRDASGDYRGLVPWHDKRLPGGFNQAKPDTVKRWIERGQRTCGRFGA
jgi:hypothetical protein